MTQQPRRSPWLVCHGSCHFYLCVHNTKKTTHRKGNLESSFLVARAFKLQDSSQEHFVKAQFIIVRKRCLLACAFRLKGEKQAQCNVQESLVELGLRNLLCRQRAECLFPSPGHAAAAAIQKEAVAVLSPGSNREWADLPLPPEYHRKRQQRLWRKKTGRSS